MDAEQVAAEQESREQAQQQAQRQAEEQAARMLAGDAASRSLGIAITGVRPGAATATMTVREDMLNGHGICHGGWVFTLADTAFAFACNTYGPVTVAAGATIDFLEPARAGDVLVATAEERVRRGRTGLYDVRVTAGDVVVAEFRGRSRHLADSARG